MNYVSLLRKILGTPRSDIPRLGVKGYANADYLFTLCEVAIGIAPFSDLRECVFGRTSSLHFELKEINGILGVHHRVGTTTWSVYLGFYILTHL